MREPARGGRQPPETIFLDSVRVFVHGSFVSAAAAPSDLAGRLTLIVDLLRRHLAARASRDRAFGPLLLILWNRLSRLVARFAAIAARQRAGTLRKPSGKPRRPRTTPATPPPRDKLPRERGWLVRRAIESVPYGNYLQLLLEEPEMQALIEQAPQLRRILRPLWRMLRLEPPPAILRSPAPPKPRKPRKPRRRRRRRNRRAKATRQTSPRYAATPPRRTRCTTRAGP